MRKLMGIAIRNSPIGERDSQDNEPSAPSSVKYRVEGEGDDLGTATKKARARVNLRRVGPHKKK